MARAIQPDIVINNRTGHKGDYDTPEQRIGGFQIYNAGDVTATAGIYIVFVFMVSSAGKLLADTLRREAAPARCVVVDCLTLWVSNLLADAHTLPAGATAEDLPLFRRERDALLAALPTLPGHIILVANEVGHGLVPETALGRLFRDEAGRLNQVVAALCPRVVFVAAGLPLVLKQAKLQSE